MTLFRQLSAAISLLFCLLLAGIGTIYLHNARGQLQVQLEAHAHQAATALSLRLALLGSLEDRAQIESVMRPLFDRGDYQEIWVVSTDGKTAGRIVAPPRPGNVPQWFAEILPMRAAGGEALVSSGWRELGRVLVVAQPNFASQQLWDTGLRTFAWIVISYAVALAAAIAFISLLLKPLRDIERTAVAIGERNFEIIGTVPRTRELARVVAAMNDMSDSIRRAIAEANERTETLRREAFIDPLTTLYNRRGFEDQLQALIASTADVYCGVLALLEFRDFAKFNARHGRQRGDVELEALASALTDASKLHPVICGRVGGASFAMAAVNLDVARARDLLDRVCGRMRNRLVESGLDSELHFHGGATHHDGPLPKVSALLAAADQALQQARYRGDNEFVLEAVEHCASLGSLGWRKLIEHCIADGGFALFSQDVFAIPQGAPVHREVTVGLIAADSSLVAAAQFVPMAARHGLIEQIDCLVLGKLLDHLDANPGGTAVAMNVAGQTVRSTDASSRLLALLDDRSRLANRLIFEMTEFGAMHDIEVTRRFSMEVRRRGARFALDNFGMRQNALILVHALRPEYIKLSASYTREIANNMDCRFLVTSLIRIAEPFGIGVYAQAVEDAAVIPLLAGLGLAGFQGFAMDHPARIF